MKTGRIIKALSGFYYVECDGIVHTCRARGKFRNIDLKPLVGDICDFTIEDDNDGYVMAIHERRNELIRPPISNVDQALLVFSAKEPDLNLLLLDRFLVLIESEFIQPIICITKMDLVDEEEIKRIMLPYERAGYIIRYICSKKGIGLDLIKADLKDNMTVVTGQSGVGKSSLLNSLDLKLNIETNEISKALGRGKHTTRHVELMRMYGGYIADTPGFSSLDLNLEPLDVAVSYHDFRELSTKCKFRGCLHDSEPKCAVKEAVENDDISKERYEHYLSFLKEAKELKEKKYG